MEEKMTEIAELKTRLLDVIESMSEMTENLTVSRKEELE